MAERKPQISVQVAPRVKYIYDAAKDELNAIRLCSAGLIYLLENPAARTEALNRLNWIEGDDDAPSTPNEARAYVEALRGRSEASAALREKAIAVLREKRKQKPSVRPGSKKKGA